MDFPPQDETPLELLSRLVERDSVNPIFNGPGEVEVAAFVENWLSERGIACRKQKVDKGRNNLIARIGPEGAPALLLEAHMDTVGVGGWANGDPFTLTRRDNRYFGRGACDTKASLACFMLTLSYFHRNPEQLNRALVFVASVDEESEQLGAYELAKLKQELGIAWAITGEPTCSDVVSRHKGVGRYCLRTSGKAAHGSTPELGDNAIFKAARICGRLEELARDLAARPAQMEIERGTLNLGMITGGIGFNVVPDACSVDVDRRFGSVETAECARAELEALCADEPGSELTIFVERPPLLGEISRDFVSELLGAGRLSGVEMADRQVAYMTNAVAYEAAGIPSVVFGPGDIAQAHKNDEHIEAGEMEKCLRVLQKFLRVRQ